MNTPTLYLDTVILASTAYPSGISYSLFNAFRGVQGRPRTISTRLLAFLVLPYPAVIAAVWFLRPSLLALSWHGTSARFRLMTFGIAVLLVPVALAVEYVIHAFAIYRTTGRFPRAIVVQNPWPGGLSLFQHLLLALIAAGEEIFYRMIWLGAMLSLGLHPLLALGISSLAYGLNHLFFGGLPVVSKTVTGCIYGSLYLLGGQSVWLPMVTHVLQNVVLFQVAQRMPRDA